MRCPIDLSPLLPSFDFAQPSGFFFSVALRVLSVFCVSKNRAFIPLPLGSGMKALSPAGDASDISSCCHAIYCCILPV